MKMKFPIVMVKWNDAHSSATDAHTPESLPHAPMVMVTYGLLLRHDAIGVSLAAEDCGDGTYRGLTFVPAGMIISVTPVGAVKKKRKVVAERITPLQSTLPATPAQDSAKSP